MHRTSQRAAPPDSLRHWLHAAALPPLPPLSQVTLHPSSAASSASCSAGRCALLHLCHGLVDDLGHLGRKLRQHRVLVWGAGGAAERVVSCGCLGLWERALRGAWATGGRRHRNSGLRGSTIHYYHIPAWLQQLTWMPAQLQLPHPLAPLLLAARSRLRHRPVDGGADGGQAEHTRTATTTATGRRPRAGAACGVPGGKQTGVSLVCAGAACPA